MSDPLRARLAVLVAEMRAAISTAGNPWAIHIARLMAHWADRIEDILRDTPEPDR